MGAKLNFNADFVFGEVNRDRVIWEENTEGARRIVRVDPLIAGTHIVTKAVGENRLVEMEGHYKNGEECGEMLARDEAAKHG